MKKKLINDVLTGKGGLRKMPLIMRLTAFLFFSFLVSLNASVYSADTHLKLDLELKGKTMREAFELIEVNSKCRFFYNTDLNDVNRIIDFSTKNSDLEPMLNRLFADSNISDEIQGGNLIVLEVSDQQPTSTVRGRVTDANGQPLPGVAVVVKGTTQGTVTDSDGNYSLTNIPEDATLVFSFVGMLTQEVTVDNQPIIDIRMEEETFMLEEVVAVGYGTQKKVNLTGAVGVASSEVFENRTITSVGQGLLGVIPGLNITYTSGDPTKRADFNIRGFESISGGEPLILVDGVPMEVERINPNDIESVSVLKDASSAAIYGARASFGVILVTTKKGKLGKTKVNFSSQLTVQNMIFPGYEPIKEGGTARKLMNEARQVTFGRILYPEYVVDAAMAYQEMSNPGVEDAWYRADDWLYYLGTNHPKDLGFKDFSPQQQYNINVSGASEKASYYVSLGAIDKEGFFKYNNEKFNRYNVLSRVDFYLFDWLTLEEKLAFTSITNDLPHEYLANYYYNSIGTQWFSVPPEFPDLEYYRVPGDRAEYEQYIGMLSRTNPAAYQKYGGRDTSRENEILFSQGVTISPLPGLMIKGEFAYNSYWANQKRVHSEIEMADSKELGFNLTKNIINKDKTANDYINFSSTLNRYVVTNIYGEYIVQGLNNHYLKALLGFNQEYQNSHVVSTTSNELITPSTPSLSTTTGNRINSEGGGEFMIRGAFYRLNYSYMDKYLFEANGRYDGSSKFPRESRFGFFPSFSGGWRLSEESFMDATNEWLDGLKIRASWGKLGNQNVGSYYPYISVMSPGTTTLLLDSSGDYPRTIAPGSLISDQLTWETVISKNIGIDIITLDNRLDVSFDYFIRDTKDMLMRKHYPGVLGTTAPYENAADLRNEGWEVNGRWAGRLGKDWSYRINFSLSDHQTTITKYDNPTGAINDYYVGKKIGEIWGYQSIGLFQTEDELANAADQSRLGSNWRLGDVHYADLDGDEVITPGNNTLDDTGDRIRIGNTTPRYSFGINPSIKYKNFALDVFVEGALKRDWMPTSSNSRRFFPFKYMAIEDWWIEDSWSPDNPDGYFPGIQFAYSDNKNYVPQTRWLQNGAYLRLKSVTLSYNIPLKFCESAQVYINGENLGEIHSMYKTLSPWFTSDLTPQYFFHRSLTFGINVTL